ncbi:GcrA family cell cycle regulator [Denitrobaculum tricleocarpae]|uniref:GcrA cell cycle regulator n=1 Tax=Denitrobaculum tricleocarpae TaxID=2591009 RepID=A0A545TMJ9_9PROT|nr:GcrA family cell cycle regulator [Denitrobaculum tricleocarpae]TQV78416.1 GcrA cell cycle regulator [Denitrobaculum tricleocarpae]
MSWTPERIDELTRLWESGQSASAIGKLLGVSKNAVVGKAHRMKLQARPSPIKRGDDGGASNSASSAKPAARQSSASARAARPASTTAGTDKGAAKNEPLQTVISAALAAKSAGSGNSEASSAVAAKAAAAVRNGQSASGAQSAAQAPSVAKAARGTSRDSVASATRAVNASRRGPKCLWPIGDPGDADFHFCGEPALSGKPYCAEHCAKAYITRSRSDSAAA